MRAGYHVAMTDFGDPLDTSSGIPYDLFARLRSEAPVWRTASGVWFFSLFDDVLAATKDIDSFKSSFPRAVAGRCALLRVI